MELPDGFVDYEPGEIKDRNKENMRGTPGCYALVHKPTGNFYIGSTGNIGNRCSQHLSKLKNGTHSNTQLQAVYTDRKEIAFLVKPQENTEAAVAEEQRVVDLNSDDPALLNIARVDVTKSHLGVPATEKQAQALMDGRSQPMSDERKQRLSESQRGRVFKEETIQGLRDAWARTKAEGRTEQRLAAAHAAVSIQVVVDGQTYTSKAEAAKALGIPLSTFKQRFGKGWYPQPTE